jgi:hypothetical protein
MHLENDVAGKNPWSTSKRPVVKPRLRSIGRMRRARKLIMREGGRPKSVREHEKEELPQRERSTAIWAEGCRRQMEGLVGVKWVSARHWNTDE